MLAGGFVIPSHRFQGAARRVSGRPSLVDDRNSRNLQRKQSLLQPSRQIRSTSLWLFVSIDHRQRWISERSHPLFPPLSGQAELRIGRSALPLCLVEGPQDNSTIFGA